MKSILIVMMIILAANCNRNLQARPYLLIPPSGSGDPFSTACFNPFVSGFILRATCTDNNGNPRNASVNFGNCIKNYDGNLSVFTGATEELFTKSCFTDGINLICSCQQPTGGYAQCSIPLDTVFFVNNGSLSC